MEQCSEVALRGAKVGWKGPKLDHWLVESMTRPLRGPEA